MAADVKFSVKRATDDQSLIPTNVNVGTRTEIS